MKNNVVTRIPPSPTGHLHIGTARTALFNYLYARHHGGQFIVRSEDTDRARSKDEFEKEIREGLEWLGITNDGYTRQSENLERHKEVLQKLVKEDKAYISKEPKKDSPEETVEVVRLRNEGRSITFMDEIRGNVTFDTTELGDFVIARAIDDPLYHLAVVVDDFDAGVTHVIRGEDHISNTPRQILIQEAIGAPRPFYAHLPLILAPDRSKLSKRHGAVGVYEYRDAGYMPEAIVNFLALLGWSPKSDREDFSLEELVEAFDLSHVHKHGAIFDTDKFKSVNQRWMRKLSSEEFIARGNLSAPNAELLMAAVPLLQERAQTFGEAREMLEGELSFLFGEPVLDTAVLTQKEGEGGATARYLTEIIAMLHEFPKEVTAESVKEKVMLYADKEGRGAVLWPLRYALTGKERSPDPFTVISLLSPSTAASRLEAALAILKE
ncbi:MAG: glutamate--tRNA ligase [Parcubacteria bacterium C7867-001]|nr:MAG: glutamate--tRNA ligase [Parcubacteria bacterium C7867-001]